MKLFRSRTSSGEAWISPYISEGSGLKLLWGGAVGTPQAISPYISEGSGLKLSLTEGTLEITVISPYISEGSGLKR